MACRVKIILVARGEDPEEVLGAGEGFPRHLQSIKRAPITLESGYEFISRCLSAFGLLVAEMAAVARLRRPSTQAASGL
ncbi:hypothetical protein D8L93_01765 [Sodalis-like symbiont of Bactericera trigonica]|nr:hypothetical protein D8L93_01765 [Sodalis-like symbiont of Bactericera trigonica]